jgi:polyisoprenyl-phosphate glycosyltransferase
VSDDPTAAPAHALSVVIPVYQGERTLPSLVAELVPYFAEFTTPAGHRAVVQEILLVHDNGPDDSARVMRELADAHENVRTIWLSRNFGQHPATLAGLASAGGDWIVTMDEDGQHDPAALPAMLDVAMSRHADVVYAEPTNAAPHGVARNVASRGAKRLLRFSSGGLNATDFQSYRLMLGQVGRSVAAYVGAGVYLDVALLWVARTVATCPVTLRAEGGRPSGYTMRKLVSHFWRMVVSSGTRALRLVSLMGVLFAVGGLVLALYFLLGKLIWDAHTPQGWPSLMVALLVCSGAVLFALGVIAEYIGVAVNMAMGRPLYLIVDDPADGPLGRPPADRPAAAAIPGQPAPSTFDAAPVAAGERRSPR